MDIKAKIRKRIRIDDNGCWVWIGSISQGGYGKVGHYGKTVSAHRLSYTEFVGLIPQGLQLDHLCRNRACVNPDHLEPVTCRENLSRGNTWQAKNAAKTHCPHGHEYTESNTYFYPDGRRRCIACRRLDDLRPHYAERRRLYKRQMRANGATW